jgi:putative phage-type endonuclease
MSIEQEWQETLKWFFSESTMRAGTLPHHTKFSFRQFSKQSQEEEVPPSKPEFPPVDDLTLRHYYYKHIHRTPEECAREGEWEQRSEEWKNARKFALTASDFGAASGTNPFESSETLLQKKLYETFQGNAATLWGSTMEPLAAEAFLQYAKHSWGVEGSQKLHHPNLVKFSSSSWLAVSPDGVLEYMDSSGKKHYDLVEFKCPTKAPTGKHPYSKYEGNIPPYYASQMLGIWGYCNSNGGIMIEGRPVVLERVWFVVWQPSDLWVSPFVATQESWNALHVSLRKWYFELFLPSLYKTMRTVKDSRDETLI